ncbi:MAG: metallophosphoesterase [Cyanobacteriota bacterium]|nr:metallophosphoesterase [Cyanobacteriota bacterium]
MKILVGSDYHGSEKLMQAALDQIPEVDFYVNCGDFCSQAGAQPLDPHLGYHPRGKAEVEQLRDFLAEVDQLGKAWLFLPGNHDPAAPVLENFQGSHGVIATTACRLQLLGLELVTIPWTPPCGWNWSLTSTRLQELVESFSDERNSAPQPLPRVDLLITHAPPQGVLDEGGKWYHKRTPTLRPLVSLLDPRYYLCGHMHLDGGKVETHGNTTYVNAALHNLVLELI